MLIVLAAGLGLILGSFLSVLLERLGRKEGIVAGRSECPQCLHALGAHDLIPVISYLMLRGRCRYCRARISALYPALELTMAAVFGVYVLRYGIENPWQLIDLPLLFGFVALFFFDLEQQILPDIIVFPMVGLAVLRLVTQRPDLLIGAGVTGIVLASVLGLLYLISHGRWLGFGDVKLALLIGLLFGYPAAIGVTLVAIWSGALVGVMLMLRGHANMKTALPFGSFWTAAAVLTIIVPGPVYFLSGLLAPVLK